jgi:hypothetical protein
VVRVDAIHADAEVQRDVPEAAGIPALGARVAHQDPAVPEAHLRVSRAAVRSGHAHALLETEGPARHAMAASGSSESWYGQMRGEPSGGVCAWVKAKPG